MMIARLSAVAVFLFSLSLQAVALADDVPDLSKTPGVARLGLSKATICSTKWGRDERHVTDAMKQQVFALYGYGGYDDPRCVEDAHGRTCEIDHMISRDWRAAYKRYYGNP